MITSPVRQEYQRLRALGFRPIWALYSAKINDQFAKAERAGLVRLVWEPDGDWTMEGLKGYAYCPEANPDIPKQRLKAEEALFTQLVESEGVWGICGEYRETTEDLWKSADSLWRFVGTHGHEYYQSVLRKTTLEALRGLERLTRHTRKLNEP